MDVSKFNLFGVLFNFKDKKARDDLAVTNQTVDAQGTDIAELKVPAFSEPAANADVRTAVGNVKGGTPIGTLFTNIKAALNGLITLGEMRNYLVNNGTVTETGKYFLDAAYGKTLLDQITALNSDFKRTNIKSYISINDEEEMEQQVARHIGTPGFYFLSTSEPKGHPEINYSSGFFLCRTNTYTIVVFAYDSGSIHIQSGYKDINGHRWTGWKKLNGI